MSLCIYNIATGTLSPHTHLKMDYDDDGEEGTSIFSKSAISDLVSGRQTVFCCLSCGVPFALNNDAYIYKDEKIQDFIRFTHGVRKQICMYDRTRGSTMQWQLNLAHYLHRYLHKHMEGSRDGSPHVLPSQKATCARSWDGQFVQGATHLIACVQGIVQNKADNKKGYFFSQPPITMNQAFMDITSPCCHACNIAASHTVKIKRALGIQTKAAARLRGG